MANEGSVFHPFDPEAEVDITYGHLPHWFQPGTVVFITFRLVDSIPQEAIQIWDRQQREWLHRHRYSLDPKQPIPFWDALPTDLQSSFRRYRDRMHHEHLDNGYGECHLRSREIAELVLDTIKHFDGERYELDCAVIMPNHVHLLAAFPYGTTCRKQCTSWTHFSATQINRILGRRGAFWQTEPFDHIVRSAEQFSYLRNYIARNGPSANLPRTDYLYWNKCDESKCDKSKCGPVAPRPDEPKEV